MGYVDKVEAFDVATDGACQSDRPVGQEKNKKWYPEDCSSLTTVTAHPLKKPAAFKMLGLDVLACFKVPERGAVRPVFLHGAQSVFGLVFFPPLACSMSMWRSPPPRFEGSGCKPARLHRQDFF